MTGQKLIENERTSALLEWVREQIEALAERMETKNRQERKAQDLKIHLPSMRFSTAGRQIHEPGLDRDVRWPRTCRSFGHGQTRWWCGEREIRSTLAE